MSAVLDLRVKRTLQPVPQSDWGWKSEPAVISYMIDKSGLKEKTIAIEIGIDASTLSKVKQGTARLSEEQLDKLMDCTGSEAWLIYHHLKRGYDPGRLHKLESLTEQALRQAEERIAELEREQEVITRFVGKAQSAR